MLVSAKEQEEIYGINYFYRAKVGAIELFTTFCISH